MKNTEQQSAVVKMRSGRHIDLLSPEQMVSMIDIDDIAYSLSKMMRFNGHTSRPYSVAEHCLRGVAYSLPQHRLEFLLHDATEAYLGDVVGPLKRCGLFEAYRELESRWAGAVAERYGIAAKMSKEVHETDKRMLVTEERDLMGRPPASNDSYLPFEGIISNGAAPHPDEVAERFIAKFYRLTKVTVGAKR
jgi:uncharacterized protein